MTASNKNRLGVLWALAKSPELNFNNDDLHAIVYSITGKESMKNLTDQEITKVANALKSSKDKIDKAIPKYRTDTEGEPDTIQQRKLIWHLTKEVGWGDDPKRIDGFCQRMFKKDLKQLDMYQCNTLIESLKKIKERAS